MEKELHKCFICNVSLGESNNTLYVDGQWMHYTCAFQQTIQKLRIKQIEEEENG